MKSEVSGNGERRGDLSKLITFHSSTCCLISFLFSGSRQESCTVRCADTGLERSIHRNPNAQKPKHFSGHISLLTPTPPRSCWRGKNGFFWMVKCDCRQLFRKEWVAESMLEYIFHPLFLSLWVLEGFWVPVVGVTPQPHSHPSSPGQNQWREQRWQGRVEKKTPKHTPRPQARFSC